ncbi:hypothetical protein HDV00_004701 [Rhizophlyctis rosea]|nr:hypothetical protein HDV00_004701 [Rhizophlyctis rosea]
MTGGTRFSIKQDVFLTLANYFYRDEVRQQAQTPFDILTDPQHPYYSHIPTKDPVAFDKRWHAINKNVGEYLALTANSRGGRASSGGAGNATATMASGSGIGTESGNVTASGSSTQSSESSRDASYLKRFARDLAAVLDDEQAFGVNGATTGSGADHNGGNGAGTGSGADHSGGNGAGTGSGADDNSTDAVKTQLQLLLVQVDNVMKSKIRLEQRVEHLVTRERHLLQELERIRSDDTQRRIANLEATNAGFHAAMASERKQSRELEGKLRRMENEVRLSRLERTQWIPEKETLLKRNSKLEKQTSSLQCQIDQLRDQLTSMETELMSAIEKERRTAQQNSRVQIMNGTSQRTIQQLKENLQQAEDDRQVHYDAWRAKTRDVEDRYAEIDQMMQALGRARETGAQSLATRTAMGAVSC